MQYESSGTLKGRVLYIGVNQNSLKLFSLNAGYLNFDFQTDADSADSFPQYSFDTSEEFAPPFWQARHFLFLSVNTNLPWGVRLSSSLNASSGRPFNVTTGRDNNGDGNFNDRPGIAADDSSHPMATSFGPLDPNAVNGNLSRNLGTNPASMTVNLNASRTFVFGKKGGDGQGRYQLIANIRAENLLNRSNLSEVSGVLTSSSFGRPTIAAAARRIEMGLRFSF